LSCGKKVTAALASTPIIFGGSSESEDEDVYSIPQRTFSSKFIGSIQLRGDNIPSADGVCLIVELL